MANQQNFEMNHFCRKVIIDENGNKVWGIDTSRPKKMPKNSEPIREGVAVITETTTMEQMQQLAQQIEQRWGIKTRGQEQLQAKEAAEYVERKKVESNALTKAINEGNKSWQNYRNPSTS